MKIPRKKSEAIRKRILTVGIALFRKRGFHAVGVQEIADAAKIPKGSFYNYFATKEKFAVEAMSLYAEGARARVRQYVDDASTPPDEIVVRIFKDRIASEKQMQRRRTACLGNMLGQELGGYSANLRKASRQLSADIRTPLLETLTAARSNGWLHSPMAPEQLAEFLESSWRGAMLASRARLDHAPLQAFDAFVGTLFRRPD